MPHEQRPHQPRAAHPGESEPPRWLDSPRNVNGIVWGLAALCIVLLAVDPLIHKHGPFRLESYWGFYGILGFVACVVLVLAARLLRRLVMRPEDYYER